MKILYLSEFPYTDLGGISTHIKAVSTQMKKVGDEVYFLSATDFDGFKLFDKKLVPIKTIYQKLKDINPNVIHIHGFSSFFVANALIASKKLGSKIVYTPHYHPFNFHNRPNMAKAFFYFYLKSAISKADCIVVLSEEEKLFFKSHFQKSHIEVIPNGIVLNRDENFIKKVPAKKNLLFIGRDDTNKRLDFLESFKDYFEKNDIYCKVVSDVKKTSSKYFTYLTNLTDEELKRLYQDAYLVIIPSKYEAFSLVALESLSLGTPVLISDRVQIKSYFDRSLLEINGIFPYDDKEKFLIQLNRIISIDSSDYEIGAKRNIEFAYKFDWSEIARKLRECYQNR
jgi:glycosyltransferase involved in cell wall biosynthesis